MPQGRYYLDDPLTIGNEILLKDEEARHLIVMRAQENEEIEIVNGRGDLAKGAIIKIDKRECRVLINELFHESESSFPFIIAQGIPRAARLDTILEKGTELGMSEIWLFPAEKSEKTTFSAQQNHRIEKLLIAALKQSGRLYLPKVKFIEPIKNWKELHLPAFFGAFRESLPSFFTAWKQLTPARGAIFIIGPESGLTTREEIQLETLKTLGVTLHQNILRTDTAPLAALILMNHFYQTNEV